MTKRFALLLALGMCLALALFNAGSLAQELVELRFLCFEERNECQVYAELLSRFSADNPDIVAAVEIAPKGEIEARLLAQIEAGQAPDIARLSDFDALAGHYLDLRQWLANELTGEFPPSLLRRASRRGLTTPGYMAIPMPWLWWRHLSMSRCLSARGWNCRAPMLIGLAGWMRWRKSPMSRMPIYALAGGQQRSPAGRRRP